MDHGDTGELPNRPVLLLVTTDDLLRREWRAWAGRAFAGCRVLEADTTEMIRWALCRECPRVVVIDEAGFGARIGCVMRLVCSLAPRAEHLTLRATQSGAGDGDFNRADRLEVIFPALQMVFGEILGDASPVAEAPP